MSPTGKRATTIVWANGTKRRHSGIRLSYGQSEADRIDLRLPRFVERVGHLPARILDLIEIAAYVMAADREVSRGSPSALVYDAWSRAFSFRVQVRDIGFWSRRDVQSALRSAIGFTSGDQLPTFVFSPGRSTPPAHLFDLEGVPSPEVQDGTTVGLFSGGLDSLAGVQLALATTKQRVLLVSHRARPDVQKTQARLVERLLADFPNRVTYVPFDFRLRGIRATEETQRTRAFLFGAVAFATATAFGLSRFSVYENGVTSVNLQRREDQLLARASRTTHPKTIRLLQDLYTLVAEKPFAIDTPFLGATKADVIRVLCDSGGKHLIDSSVSCSGAFTSLPATHCGECFQCVERRLACLAAGVGEEDPGTLYSTDTFSASFSDQIAKTVAVDYVALGIKCAKATLQQFAADFASEISDAEAYLPGSNYNDRVTWLWRLYQKHGEAVRSGIDVLRAKEDLSVAQLPNSFLAIVGTREYLKTPVDRLADRISEILRNGCEPMFRRKPPADENDMNQKVGALLKTHYDDLRREFPSTPFACSEIVPDMTIETRLVVESKFIRTNTGPAKVSEGIAADCIKIPPEQFCVFLVLDPGSAIKDDIEFKRSFEGRRRCRIVIIR